MRRAFYTVGHSTRTIDEFVTLLRVGEVEHLVDVRAMPRSRSNPQFNHDALPDALAPLGIGYTHSVALAGLRSRSKTVGNDVNGYWHNRSFHNYADYALSEAFRQGLAELIELGHCRTCAVMCAEAVWWRCHRSMVSDYLKAKGWEVLHIMGVDRADEHPYTSPARVVGDRVSYSNQK